MDEPTTQEAKPPELRKCKYCGRPFTVGRRVKGILTGVGETCQQCKSRVYRESPLAGKGESTYGDNSALIAVHCSPELKAHLETKAGGQKLSQWCRDTLARVSKFVAPKKG